MKFQNIRTKPLYSFDRRANPPLYRPLWMCNKCSANVRLIVELFVELISINWIALLSYDSSSSRTWEASYCPYTLERSPLLRTDEARAKIANKFTKDWYIILICVRLVSRFQLYRYTFNAIESYHIHCSVPFASLSFIPYPLLFKTKPIKVWQVRYVKVSTK